MYMYIRAMKILMFIGNYICLVYCYSRHLDSRHRKMHPNTKGLPSVKLALSHRRGKQVNVGWASECHNIDTVRPDNIIMAY